MNKRMFDAVAASLRRQFARVAAFGRGLLQHRRVAPIWARVLRFVGMATPEPGAGNSADLAAAASLRRVLRPVVTLGFGFGVLLVCSLATWAGRAQLASAAVAQGNVSPDSGRRVIQHLEGGIIRAINVKDGQVVKEGDVLYTLEPVQARALFSSKHQQWMRLMVTRARLERQRTGESDFTPPSFPESDNDAGFQKFVADQIALFGFRRKSLLERDQILGQQILQLGQQTEAKLKEIDSQGKQLAFLDDEIGDKKQLIERNLARKPEWLALERARADIMGRMASNESEIARIGERVSEIKLSILINKTQFDQEISDQLTKTNGEISQLEETLPASRDVLNRTDIVAPVDGTVFNLRFKTVGGVVRPGEALLDIEPVDDDLIIDAKLSPNDIDVVHAGLIAEVYLTPYVSRHTPRLKGTVIRVSPDIMRENSQGGMSNAQGAGASAGNSYYEVKVRIDRHEFSGLAENLQLFPGMPAEVYIMTGTRTFAEYLTDPLAKSFRRAFREK